MDCTNFQYLRYFMKLIFILWYICKIKKLFASISCEFFSFQFTNDLMLFCSTPFYKIKYFAYLSYKICLSNKKDSDSYLSIEIRAYFPLQIQVLQCLILSLLFCTIKTKRKRPFPNLHLQVVIHTEFFRSKLFPFAQEDSSKNLSDTWFS